MKAKNKLVVRSKEEAKNVMFWLEKKHIKGGKHIAPMDFAEYLRKSDVSDNNKIYYGQFLRNGLHERDFCISKSRENV